MRSTFQGLETARRGMFTQQTALQVTGHNISNANTPGYTRQRVNFTQTEPYPAAAMNRPNIPGQMGTGVQAGSIQRVREGFLDTQFREENNKFGYWNTRSEALAKMEDIMNEPSDNGLSKTLDRFWQSLQDLSVHPEDDGARSVVRQRGEAVSDTFNYLSNSLNAIRNDHKSQIDLTVKEINSLATQINNINSQINEIEPHGYLPNDLYDERDNLVDRLSQLVNIKVTPVKSGGNAIAISEGKYTIDIIDKNGASLGKLVDGTALTSNELQTVESNGTVSGYQLNDGATATTLSSTEFRGKLQGLTDAYNTVFPEMLANLDQLAYDFATSFNSVHNAGWTMDDVEVGLKGNGIDFFAVKDASGNDVKIDANQLTGLAGKLKISNPIKNDLDKIAAASPKGTDTVAYSGDGSNALALANVKDTTQLKSKYESMIGGMAVSSQESVRLSNNSLMLTDTVDKRRQSVSGVSLDEEMTNMIQFQHAYNASARNITVIDEMLDKIINGMGVGGR
ncbi:flagellar hook-associated protein FlgK [Fictibacillus sp. b24]|uniref:flagellar hook-associated protein FlgK n=1 Tax=Fictibacillus sp. b24 TaxID=3055863 RepID=UPI0025A29ECC|nr:flagellar hook-associated protein FlgK [Fictibacillus sp. b24]MDM5315077.1 flagellar hook-associated protein FlgK [Fictibacillus sp. b24]